MTDSKEFMFTQPREPQPREPQPHEPRPQIEATSFVEQVLSPTTLRRMMASGGGLLVLGFIGWLWSIGVFENPLTAAVSIGALNLGVLLAGISLVRISRYQLAGSGLTLLASLAMPLNLWFYNAQGLITIHEGGHLWIPAAICCGIYAMVARTLRQPVFVYTFVGGVVMTGMLILADQSIGHFWELLPQATFLVIIGWVCIHAERLFAEGKGDFSRANFGRAFYLAGSLVLGSGLALLLGGHLVSLFYEFFFQEFPMPMVATDDGLKLWANGLILGSAIGFSCERFFAPQRRASSTIAMALLGWSGLGILDLFSIQPNVAHVGIAGALVTIAVHGWSHLRGKDGERPFVLALPIVSLTFLAVAQFLAQFLYSERNLFFALMGWTVVVQLTVTATACFATQFRLSKYLDDQADSVNSPSTNSPKFGFVGLGGVLSTLASIAAVLTLGWSSLAMVATSALLLPVAFSIASIFATNVRRRAALQSAASCGALTMLICAVPLSLTHFVVAASSIPWCLVLAAAATVFFLAGRGKSDATERTLGYLTATLAICQGLAGAGLSIDYSLALSATIGGTLLAIMTAIEVRRSEGTTAKAKSAGQTANILVIGGSVVGMLLAMSRVVADEVNSAVLVMLVCQLGGTAINALLTDSKEWRLAFRASAVGTVGAGLAALNTMFELHWLHRFELVSIVAGLTLLVIGHIAWFREGESRDEAATYGLYFGSLLTAVPLAIGLTFYRSFEVQTGWNWMLFHEVVAIVAGLALLGTGLACQIRSTTVAGVSLLTIFVATLLTLIQWPNQLQSVSVVMMVGGGAFFVVAVLLSIYRDRIASLPKHIREGRGVFRVLRWR